MAKAIVQQGIAVLERIRPASEAHFSFKQQLLAYCSKTQDQENAQSWFVCAVALEAAVLGNFGVGAALFNEDHCLLEYAGNEFFMPRFRSDGHAEMMVLNKFEENQKIRTDLTKATLVTSLESCPMCLTRLISAQVGKVFHVADDNIGGMTRKRFTLPGVWQALQVGMDFRQAACTDELKALALAIFLSDIDALLAKLKKFS